MSSKMAGHTTSDHTMHWYLVHTKPRQEKVALKNLEQQGYVCYLPVLHKEKLRGRNVSAAIEALFPRYLFIQLEQGGSGRGWSPIRSTKGVSRLVAFGLAPAEVDPNLISLLKALEANTPAPTPLFRPGEKVVVANGAFAGLEAIYQMPDGASRAMVLIEMLNQPIELNISPADLRKES